MDEYNPSNAIKLVEKLDELIQMKGRYERLLISAEEGRRLDDIDVYSSALRIINVEIGHIKPKIRDI